MGEKLSNVIGAPFSETVLKQLGIRATRNSTTQRTNEEVLFLANKTGWVRLISSVDVNNTDLQNFYGRFELPTSTYNAPQSLAKNWILQSGLSIKQGQGITLRSGIGEEGAYGMGGTEELGYRPLPGVTSVTVETTGRLGSLRQATINFKVWNMNQLNVIEALYFRLGYSMLLEWGHTQFFNNPTNNTVNQNGTFEVMTNSFGLEDPFAVTDKTVVQQKISKKSKELSGNYDGMLGIVSNFNWSMNQEGGYDCTVRLIGLGSIINTVRINQSYKMPESVKALVTQAEETIRKNEEKKAKLAEEDKKKRLNAEQTGSQQQVNSNAIPVPKNKQELYQAALKSGYIKSETNFFEDATYWPSYTDTAGVSTVPDYFYLSTGPDAEYDNEKTFGLFITKGGTTWNVLHPVSSTTFKVNMSLFNSILNEHLQEFYSSEIEKLSTDKNPESSYLATKLIVYKPNRNEKLNVIANNGEVGLPFVYYNRKIVKQDLANNEKKFSIKISLAAEQSLVQEGYVPTVGNFLEIMEKWSYVTSNDSKSTTLQLVDPYFTVDKAGLFTANRFSDVIVTAKTPDYDVIVPYTGDSRLLQNTTKTVKIWLEFEFDNTALIDQVGVSEPKLPVETQSTGSKNTGDTGGIENTATEAQINPAEKYQSALHVMLTTVKTIAYAQTSRIATTEGALIDVEKIDIQAATKAFYQDGILRDVLSKPVPSTEVFNTSPFDVTYYAQKGFNSKLLLDALSDKSLYGKIPTVNFKDLCQAYVVEYTYSTNTQYPVYITLGYLLAFLNNMCLIYDSNQKPGTQNSVKKNPYVYIDFNPDTNLCLTSPQHLSIDPQVCLIPFEGTDADYKKLFPSELVDKIPNLFKPSAENFLRGRIPKFKYENTYQGKTMNILLNVNYLVEKVNTFATSNPEHAVQLKDFLEAIMVDINKSLGNLNFFRVAYDDNSNTVQIKDDQWVPHLAGETSVLVGDQRTSSQPIRLGELPIFGLQSLVRSFQFKTNVSTKLGSMIAISAQADTGSVNATDASSFSYLNTNYLDRFKPYISDSPTSRPGNNTGTKNQQELNKENSDLSIAEHFNTLVQNIYYNLQLNVSQIDASKNYYIERMSKVKSNDTVISAAPFIPADLEIEIDGISGILMGNAFTIPENRLPLSLRGENGVPKVGFIVTGLVHEIGENQWLTKIRGQMIRLRNVTSVKVVEEPSIIRSRVVRTPRVDLSAINLNTNWVNIAFQFIASKEGFQQIAKYDVNRYRGGYGSDNKLLANGEIVPVTSTTTFTREEAELTLKYNILIPYKDGVVSQIGDDSWVELNDRQKAALISYAYNAGPGALTTWNITRAIKSKAPATQVAQFIAVGPITAKGVVLEGLRTRRAEEAKLYLS